MVASLFAGLLGLSCLVAATVSVPKLIPADTRPRLSDVDNQASTMMVAVNATKARGLDKRADGGVYICTDANWSGTCGYAQQPWNECIQLTSPYYDTISSIGPDEYNAILIYTDFNCASSKADTIFYPGSSDLDNIGWNDLIGSFVVIQLPGPNCIGDTSGRLPNTNCNDCCNGCDLSGTDCCPSGICGGPGRV